MDVLADIISAGLDVVFVGTSAGEMSARRGHYYSDPRNCFYRELHAAGFTDRLLRPEEDHQLPRYGIGLTDLAKRAASSDDRSLAESDWDRSRLEEAIGTWRPRAVCFNGKEAFEAWSRASASGWGLQASTSFEGVPVFVLPSTSGRVLPSARFSGRTRPKWFAALRSWLVAEPGACQTLSATEDDRTMGHPRQDDRVCMVVADIVARFESEGQAPYLDGDGYLRCGGRNAMHLEVYRRHNNPKLWPVPLAALKEAVSQSCASGRPLSAGECNAICNRRGTPITILLRLVPDSRYRTT